MGCDGVTQEGGSADTPLTILPPIPAGKYACNSPLPPPSAAGFVHPAIRPSPFTRPKRLFAGGGAFARKETYVMTHPVWVWDRHNGMCWKAPPTSFPFGTEKFVPSNIAEINRDCTGAPSISSWISRINMLAPCECPMRTTPLPWLSCSI